MKIYFATGTNLTTTKILNGEMKKQGIKLNDRNYLISFAEFNSNEKLQKYLKIINKR
jgi:hypothetical protein